jgi:hypothetical protein
MVDYGTNATASAGALSDALARSARRRWVSRVRSPELEYVARVPSSEIDTYVRGLTTRKEKPGLLSRLANALRPPLEDGEPEEPDPLLDLAYSAAAERLSSQSATLESYRTRAAGILSVAALVTSFAAGLGMINTDPDNGELLPDWATWALLGILVVIGFCAMSILWPKKTWAFGPSAGVILQQREQGHSPTQVKLHVVQAMVQAQKSNETSLVSRAWAYRAAVVLLLAEVGVLIVALAA